MCYELQHPVYLVPVIQQDLRQEETILQIADALDYLDQVVNDIFGRVQSRIEESKAKLEKLRKRESLAKLKVEKLTGSSKATKVNPYVLLCRTIRQFPDFSINTNTYNVISFVTLEVTSLQLLQRAQRFHNGSKHFLKCTFRNSAGVSIDFSCAMVIELELFPLNSILRFGKGKYLHITKSGLEEHCGTTVILLEIIHSSLDKQNKQVLCHSSGKEILLFMWVYSAFSAGAIQCHCTNAILRFVIVEQILMHNLLDVKKN